VKDLHHISDAVDGLMETCRLRDDIRRELVRLAEQREWLTNAEKQAFADLQRVRDELHVVECQERGLQQFLDGKPLDE
jgi:hypothetical protein